MSRAAQTAARTSVKRVVSGDGPNRIRSGVRKSVTMLASASFPVSRSARGWRYVT